MTGGTDAETLRSWHGMLAQLTPSGFEARCGSMRPPRYQRLGHTIDEPRLAATIVPVMISEGGLDVIVTRRPATMTYHRDDWVFPGGRVDDGETTAQAALRELEEELGVSRDRVQMIRGLDIFGPIVTGFEIHSFVGLVAPDTPVVPDPDEIAETARVPLADFALPGRYRRGDTVPDHDPGPMAVEGSWKPEPGGSSRALRFFAVAPGEDLWGTQADILWCLLEGLAVARVG